MESTPAPHKTLTEEEIKFHIKRIRSEIVKLKELIDVTKELDESVYKLKRHFCPESFCVNKVSAEQLMDMLGKKTL